VFLYSVTLGRPEVVSRIPFPQRQHTGLPKTLTVQELTAFLTAIRKPKYRALFMTCYAAGLRLSEVCHLRLQDIDSQRMVLRVRHGKGGKERLTVLSPRLLEVLRTYWRVAQPQDWLFPGYPPTRPVTVDSARNVFHRARAQAGLHEGRKKALTGNSTFAKCRCAGYRIPTLRPFSLGAWDRHSRRNRRSCRMPSSVAATPSPTPWPK
jgi:integrase